MGSSIMVIYEMQDTHALYWKTELSGLMQNNIFFATSNLHGSPEAAVEVEIFDIDVNSMVLELVVMATVDAGVKPKNQIEKDITLEITRYC